MGGRGEAEQHMRLLEALADPLVAAGVDRRRALDGRDRAEGGQPALGFGDDGVVLDRPAAETTIRSAAYSRARNPRSLSASSPRTVLPVPRMGNPIC